MWPGIRPATGWMAYLTSTPFDSSSSPSSRQACCAWATASPYPGTMITLDAYASWIAASSAETPRAWVAPPPADPTVPSPPPKPPTMMLMIERFIASAMSLVRMPPDAPTRAPEMIRTALCSTNPEAAAAMPVNEFRSEITTGMSAPPIGRTIVIPKTSAEAMITPRTSAAMPLSSVSASAASRISTAVPSTATTASTTVSGREPGKMIGLPLIRPWSLPDAMSEPENVTQPMAAPSTTKMEVEMLAPAPVPMRR